MSRRKPTQGKINVVNLSNYVSPNIEVIKNKEWVTYGHNNEYFRYLLDRYNGSPTNNAAVNGISQMVYGKGLNATDSSRKPDEYAQAITLIHKNCNRRLVNDLKLMGQCAIQIIYSKDRKTIAKVEHLPVETLAMEKCNEDGDVEAFYYFHDWQNIRPQDTPTRIPAFGFSKEPIEILYVKPYVAGYYYFSPVDYQGCLQYCDLEEKVSNFHLNNINHGLAPSMLINFNNGVPNEEERELVERRIQEKYSGSSNAGKFILSFNESSETASTIDAVQLSDAHNQYQFLSDESMRKIMVGHRIISPMLLGIKDNSGLGNNADELQTASTLMDNTVIRPFQELLLQAFDEILAFNNISLNLYFKTLQPLEFNDIDSLLVDDETQEEETGVKMSLEAKTIDGKIAYNTKEEAIAAAEKMGCGGYHEMEMEGVVYYMPCESHDLKSPCWDGYKQVGTKMLDGKEVPNCVPLKNELSVELSDSILQNLQHEEINNEWEVVDEIECDGNQYEDDLWANYLINAKKNLGQKLSEAVTGKPNGFSYLDKSFYKIRYKYFQKVKKDKDNPSESRDFCKEMMSRFDSKGYPAVYRLEDIDTASREGVNDSFGHKSQAYDLFKYKGGPYCHHTWKKVLYRLKSNTIESPEFSDYKRTRTIPKTYNIKPRGTADSIKAPADMPYGGHHPEWIAEQERKNAEKNN
tara:strand:- start:848 stop:2920 length:2073 start_codon:yes stop_codon:yes gene_type:complete